MPPSPFVADPAMFTYCRKRFALFTGPSEILHRTSAMKRLKRPLLVRPRRITVLTRKKSTVRRGILQFQCLLPVTVPERILRRDGLLKVKSRPSRVSDEMRGVFLRFDKSIQQKTERTSTES